MDASLFTPVNPASIPPVSPVDAAGAVSQTAMRGADFANLLGHLMGAEGRQDLAAAGLQSVPIGPQIEVITVAEPLPDAASLLAFARGQGLDDATLKALFGSATAEVSSAGATALAQPGASAASPLTALADLPINLPVGTATAVQAAGPSGADTPLPVAAVALDAARPVFVSPQPAFALPVDGQGADSPSAQAGEGAPLRPAWSLPLQMQTEALAQVAAGSAVHLTPARVQESELSASAESRLIPALAGGLAVVVPQAAPATADVIDSASAVTAPLGGAASLALASTQSGLGTGQGIGGAGTAPASAPAALATAGAPGLAAPLVAGVSDARWQIATEGNSSQAAGANSVGLQTDLSDQEQIEALRLRLAPQEAITRRLAAMSGSGEQSAWASVSGQAAATAVLRLDLRESGLTAAAAFNFASDAADVPVAEGQPSLSTAHVSAEPGRAGHAGAASTPAAWSSTAAQRAEIYEQLAQRLGEALGQRLQSQLERGQWKMQMRLDPAYLGRIDLELDMSAGALDAVFRSDNQLTRDLIAQGLPRLRESLNQSGTAVANVWVQGDSSRQSGGNPTPWRAPEPSVQAAGHETESQEPVVQATGNRARQGTSAWDVLA